jgi:integrase/recombinase XerC
VPIRGDDDTKRLLDITKGKTFMALRREVLDPAALYNTGARLSEIGNLLLPDLDMKIESVHLHGKARSGRELPRCRSCGWRKEAPAVDAPRHRADAQAPRRG